MDETGHQIAIFGRIGSRPFNHEEMAHMYLDANGNPWYVDDKVDGPRGLSSAPAPYKPHTTWDQQFGHSEAHSGGAAAPASADPNALPVVIPNGEARPLPGANGGRR